MHVFDKELTQRRKSYKDKQTCLQEMVGWLVKAGAVSDAALFRKELNAREEILPTGIGRGVALPHARSETATRFSAAVCVLDEPLDWQSLDGKPVRIVIMAAVPEESGDAYMQFMKAVSEFCRSEDNRTALLHAETTEDMLHILATMESDKR